MLADEDGQVLDAESISAGLDYPGVGPEHAFLRDSGRATYVTPTDEEAVDAFRRLARSEGILPALEPAHALARAATSTANVLLVCLSGRGDKDLDEVLRALGRLRKTLVVYLMAARRRPSSPRRRSKAGADMSSSASRSPTRSPTGP